MEVVDGELARGRSQETAEVVEQRRLAGTVASHEGDDLAGAEFEGEVAQDDVGPVTGRQTTSGGDDSVRRLLGVRRHWRWGEVQLLS